MKKKLLFVYNPHSGKGLIRSSVGHIIDIMVDAGYEVTIYPTQAAGDATEKIIEEDGNYQRIVCSGGDGTLNEAITALMRCRHKTQLGYIPSGSTNDFASTIGLSSDVLTAARMAVGEKAISIDVGCFNEEHFSYIAAFGLFTEVSYQTNQDLKNALGHSAYLLEALKQLVDVPSYELRAEIDGEIVEGEFIYGMITNSTSVGGIKDLIKGDVSLEDGLFEVMLVYAPKNPIELNAILFYLSNLRKDTSLVYTCQAKNVHVTSKEEIPWTRDGEFGGKWTDVQISNAESAIDIIVE